MATLPLSFTSPGRWGINLQEQDQLLRPEWATRTENLVLSESAQLRSRGSFQVVSTDGASTEVLRMFNYIDSTGAEIVLSTQAARIIAGVGDLDATATRVESSTAPTNGYWQFVNFNGKVLGWQASHAPIVKTSGDFADITAATGTLPDGDVAVAAFGRVWAVDDDKQTIRYCALLDETKWATADGGGSIDMRNVWTQGMDVVTGLAAFGGSLIVFGRKHIIVYSDGQGSSVGVDPTQMYVVDTIEGTGCVARDTIAAIGEGDLVFLSEFGLQSLRRLLINKNNPQETISWMVRDHITEEINRELLAASNSNTDARGWTGTYLASTGQYALVRNYTYRTEVYLFHMNLRAEDNRGRDVVPLMYWSAAPVTYMHQFIEQRDGTVYTNGTDTYEALEYVPRGTRDFYTTDIAVDYESGWVDLEDPQANAILKLLKTMQISVLNPSELPTTLTAKYGFDYIADLDELAANEASTKRVVEIYDVTGEVDGQYVKFGMSAPGFGDQSLQQVNLFIKPSRLAFIHDKDNQAVSGGEGGTVLSSTDRLLAVGDAIQTGNVMYSDDGVAWTEVTDAVANASLWSDVAYSPEYHRYVACGDNGATMYSDDGGLTWTAGTSDSTTNDFVSVAYSPTLGRFVMVAENNAADGIRWSDDGKTWTTVATATTPGGSFLSHQVIWAEEAGLFIAVGSSTFSGNKDVMTSPDGKTWTPYPANGSSFFDAVAWAPSLSKILALGGDSTRSSDATRWFDINPAGVDPPEKCLAWSPTLKLFVTVNTTGQFYYHPTGEDGGSTWPTGTNTNLGFGDGKIIWAPAFQLFVAVGSGGTAYLATSPDGKVWTERTVTDRNWRGICQGRG